MVPQRFPLISLQNCAVQLRFFSGCKFIEHSSQLLWAEPQLAIDCREPMIICCYMPYPNTSSLLFSTTETQAYTNAEEARSFRPNRKNLLNAGVWCSYVRHTNGNGVGPEAPWLPPLILCYSMLLPCAIDFSSLYGAVRS